MVGAMAVEETAAATAEEKVVEARVVALVGAKGGRRAVAAWGVNEAEAWAWAARVVAETTAGAAAAMRRIPSAAEAQRAARWGWGSPARGW